MESLILQLVAGAIGGNAAGAALKNLSLGTLGNSIAGIVGGGLGGQILGMLLGDPNVGEAVAGPGGIGAILTDVAGGGVGGGALIAIVGFIRNKVM